MDLTQASSISKDAIALQVMAAFVRLSANDGKPEIGITRLMKLVYLADRKSLIEHGRPITYSELKAMKHGPVVNRAMRVVHDGLDGGERHMYLKCPSKRAPGDDAKKRPVSASRSLGRDDLDLLSDESMAVIKETWNEWKDVQDIVAATHDLEEYRNCDEWDDDISFYSVLSAGLGGERSEADIRLEAQNLDQVAGFIPNRLHAGVACP